MPTVPSLTEVPRGLTDLRSLLAMRAGGLEARQRRRLRIGGGVVISLTLAAMVVPAYVGRDYPKGSTVGLLPTAYLGFLVLAVMSAIVSGGGREVIPREQTVAYPISSWTEHFGALLLSPLNIAWLLQAWSLLGATAFVYGPHNLPFSMLPILVWIFLSSAVGQALGWTVEGLRRGRYGVWVMRGLTATTGLLGAWLVATDRLSRLLDSSPTVRLLLLADHGAAGTWASWALGTLGLVLAALVVVLVGGVPAHWALRRPERAEARLDSGIQRPRRNPAGDLRAMVRTDRAAIWRSVPLRRGLLVLATLPGLVSAAGSLEWDLVTILPGLVASGGGLLFGVNAWALDGRGALWRDSLPADQGLAFLSKAIVLAEILLVAAAFTILLAAVRAGAPTSAELAATLACAVVVTLTVVSGCLRWSVKRPFAVDLRSARATPAPPVVMVGYSTRLALGTTFIGLIFGATALAPDWRIPVAVAMPFLAVSLFRLRRTAARWADPVVRARVVTTVAG